MMTNKHLSTCCRCLKKTDGIHTCTPSAGWRKLEERCDELLEALQSISKITGDVGFNIGGRLLEHCTGDIEHDEAKRLLSLACEYLKDTSKAAQRAISRAKGGAA